MYRGDKASEKLDGTECESETTTGKDETVRIRREDQMLGRSNFLSENHRAMLSLTGCIMQ